MGAQASSSGATFAITSLVFCASISDTMGGGNAQKTAMARAKNAAKASAQGAGGGGKDGLAKRTNNMDLKCSICMQTFPSTQVKGAQAHAESKHPKETFDKCFPMCAGA